MSARRWSVALGAALVALLALVPLAGWHIPWILPSTVNVLNATGTLEVLALCFIFGGVALGYDVLFGYTGLLSLGPVTFFGAGVYVFDIALTHWGWSLAAALAATLVVVLVLSLVLGAIALRVGGIAFAMVTLAFAQAFYYLVEDNPHNLTGGDTGLALASSRLPGFLSGAVSNTRSLYWLALVYLVLVGVVVRVVLSSATGRVLVAVRENEQRVEVLGLRPFGFKLVAFTLSSLVAAGGGVVYILLIGTAVPSAVASTTLTLSILVMVVLGGPGSAWGPVAGAFVYVYLQQLLLKVAAEPSFASLPAVARVPLSQPQFLLGALFVLFVLFVPGGFAGAVARARARRTSRRPAAPVARGDS